jgi:hypothetical protein
VFGEEFGGAEDELAVQEWISGIFVGVKGGTTLLVEEGEEEVEAAQQFHEPLMDEGFWNKNENPVSPSGEVQAVQDETGFDGLAQTHFVCEEESGSKTLDGLRGNGELVWDKINACARESPGG